MNLSLILNPPIRIRDKISLKWGFILKMFWVILLILIVLLFGIYIFQISAISKNSFLVEQYQKEIISSSEKNQNLEIYLASTDSLEEREKLIKNLGFEPVDKIHYIRIIETKIATK